MYGCRKGLSLYIINWLSFFCSPEVDIQIIDLQETKEPSKLKLNNLKQLNNLVSLWWRANARNVRLYYPYWQYTNLFIFRFVSLLCLCSTLRRHRFLRDIRYITIVYIIIYNFLYIDFNFLKRLTNFSRKWGVKTICNGHWTSCSNFMQCHPVIMLPSR